MTAYNAVQDGWHLTVSFGGRRPPIVCLCGSTRFYDQFQELNYRLTMAGEIVLSVGFYPHAKAKHGHGEGVGHDSAEKARLDELHLRKIDLADYVLVLNVGGYVGESTQREVDYATRLGKPVVYLEPQPGVEAYRNQPPPPGVVRTTITETERLEHGTWPDPAVLAFGAQPDVTPPAGKLLDVEVIHEPGPDREPT